MFDGDWTRPAPHGRLAALLLAWWERLAPDPHHDGAMSARHGAIMERLPFGGGLRAEAVVPMLEAAGFADIEVHSHESIARAQRRSNGLRNSLRTRVYDRFILTAAKPGGGAGADQNMN